MKKLLTLFLISFFTTLAMANDTIKIIAPFAAGGTTDLIARLYAKALTADNINTVVVNRPGADGKAAFNEFLNAPAAGKSLLLGGNGSIVYPSLESSDYYDNTKRIQPVLEAAIFGQILMSKKDSSIQTVEQLMAAAKTRTVTIAVGTSVAKALVTDLFGNNPNVIAVPFSGDTPCVLALQSGTVDLAFATFQYGPRIIRGEFNGLAVSTDSGVFGIKSFKEQGINVVRGQWVGFFAPVGTTPEQTKKLYNMLEKARTNPEVQDALKNQLYVVVPKKQTPEDFANNIEKEFRRLLNLKVRQ